MQAVAPAAQRTEEDVDAPMGEVDGAPTSVHYGDRLLTSPDDSVFCCGFLNVNGLPHNKHKEKIYLYYVNFIIIIFMLLVLQNLICIGLPSLCLIAGMKGFTMFGNPPILLWLTTPQTMPLGNGNLAGAFNSVLTVRHIV